MRSIPGFDGVIFSLKWKDALRDRFVTIAPRPRTRSEQQYSDHKLRSRSQAASKSTPDKTAVHSFHTPFADLSPVALNDVSVGGSESVKLVTTPTPAQQKAFDLLNINPAKLFPAAGRWDSENRVPDKEKLVFCAVKFRLAHFSITALAAACARNQLREGRGLVTCKVRKAGSACEHAARCAKAEFSASTPRGGCARSSPRIRAAERPVGVLSDSKPCTECCASPRTVWLLPSSRIPAAPASACRRNSSIP